MKKLILFLIIGILLINFVIAGYTYENGVYKEDEKGTDGKPLEFNNKNTVLLDNNAKIEKSNGITKVTLEKGGFIEISGLKYNIDLEKPNSLVFDKDGKLTDGTKFTVLDSGKFRIKGYDVPLPKGTEVVYEKDKVNFKVPKDSKLQEPEKKEEDAKKDEAFYYSTEKQGILEFPNREKVSSKNDLVLSYKDGSFYLSSEDMTVLSNSGKDDFFIKNPNYGKNDIQIVFDEKNIDKTKASVFIGNDKIILTSLSGVGAKLSFSENNRLGFEYNKDHTLAVESKNGLVILEKANKDDVPTIKLSGESIANLDKRTIFANGNDMYFNAFQDTLSGFDSGKYSLPARTTLIDNNGKRLKNFDFYSNNLDQYGSVVDGSFQSKLNFFKTGGGFYVSSSTTFNQLTPTAQEYYSRLDPAKQQQLADLTNNGEKDSASKLQQTLDNMIQEEIKVRQNPVKASVRLHVPSWGVGGSATIIGVDKEGYPILLTAGHVVSQAGVGVRVDLVDGSSINGVVIGGDDSYPNDIAIIRLNSKIPDIAYVPVPSEEREKQLTVGSTVLRIGTPYLGQFQYTKTQITEIGKNDQTSTYSGNDQIYSGQSGGGIFSSNGLYGICSRCTYFGGPSGSFTSPTIMRSYLNKFGYGYLIRFSMVFIK